MATDSRTQPRHRLFWHPHQGLWNWALVRAIQQRSPSYKLSRLLIRLVVTADTTALALQALRRRIHLLGFKKVFHKARLPDDCPVLHLDIGTHREGAELQLLSHQWLPKKSPNFQAIAFEAARDSYNQASNIFSKTEQVSLHQLALCHHLPENGRIRLYHDSTGGLGDSIYRTGDSYEEVEAVRLSDWLENNGYALEQCVCILRMNIEGAEYDVLRDLQENGLLKHVNGFYGMWDDLSKIDPAQDAEFLQLLADEGINPMTFNGRDLRWPHRLKWIEYDLDTSLMKAAIASSHALPDSIS